MFISFFMLPSKSSSAPSAFSLAAFSATDFSSLRIASIKFFIVSAKSGSFTKNVQLILANINFLKSQIMGEGEKEVKSKRKREREREREDGTKQK